MSTPNQLENELKKNQELYQSDPTSRAFAPLAETYRKMGKLNEALKVCREGLANHPGYSGAEILLGRIFMDMKNFGEAEKEFVKVIRKTPNHLLAHQFLARLYLVSGKQSHAEAIAKRIQILNPADPTAQAILTGKAKAVTPQAKAKAHPSPPTVTMAKLYEEQGHLEKALEIYKTLAKNQPDLEKHVARIQKLQANKKKVGVLKNVLKKVETYRNHRTNV